MLPGQLLLHIIINKHTRTNKVTSRRERERERERAIELDSRAQTKVAASTSTRALEKSDIAAGKRAILPLAR